MQHMEIPRLGVESELQPLAYTTATAIPDPSLVCNLHHSSRQHWILNPLSGARDRTCILMVPSQVCFRCTTVGTPVVFFLKRHTNKCARRVWFSGNHLVLAAKTAVLSEFYAASAC